MTRKISESNIQTTTLESLSGGGGSGTTAYDTIAELPLSGVEDGEMALVLENNRLYIWNGTGWFNIALINTNPSITGGPNEAYLLLKDGTPTVLTLTASDPEGIPITWSYQVTSGTLGSTATITQDGNEFTITPSTNTDHAGVFSVTFTASDGVNIATAVSTFTLVFSAADSYYNQSIVLTTSDTNNANNNTIVDSSTNNFSITRAGNVTQGSFSPYSPAMWSQYFDGSGDFLTVGSGSIFDFGTGDFTIEMWVFLTNTGGFALVDARPPSSNGPYPVLGVSTVNLDWYVNSNTQIVASSLPQLSQWAHVAVARSSGVTRMFLDGVQVGSFSDSINYGSTSAPRIGSNAFIGANDGSLFISNYRVIKGTALYTANFTPPDEPLTAVSGTSLLMMHDTMLRDGSTNNHAITRNGDVKTTPFSPFIPSAQYLPSIQGGSGYFDGTGDYLTISNPTTDIREWWTTDFTIEMWVYPRSLTNPNSQGIILGNMDPAGGANYWSFGLNSSGQAVFYYYNGSPITITSSTTSVRTNDWTHIAMVKSSAGIRMFTNGVLQGTTAVSGTPQSGSGTPFTIGAYNGYLFNGYISNARILKGTALYSDSFTPPTAPVTAVANTSLLLDFTNAGVYDETGKVVVETVNGARASTTTAKYGDTSIFFNGSIDSLVMPASPLLSYGTENFTIEAWVYPTTTAGTKPIIESRSSSASATGYAFLVNSSGQLNVYTNNGFLGSSSTALTANTWAHVALVRSGAGSNQTRYYINGVAAGTITMSGNFTDALTNITRVGASTSAGELWPGHISDLRITRGHARYTSNFTPPTAKLGYSNDE